MAKKKAKPANQAALVAQALDYKAAKARALEILDDVTMAELVKLYGDKYNAKTVLFKQLGIPPERLFHLAEEVNDHAKANPGHVNITGNALASCKTVGDFITRFCQAANLTITPPEPK
ncbi:hypothetical protein FN976_25715 [Caenimonas sedimenti]|uniref:Uncharacterized protein n=1 Tax=Caenimonas sedimenti TaxID=2596921 RepID=A0A562ZHJ8_9BURK|nr:hypothetical protein [Caenimonas sedimenti]TWO67785.1 hypothetical protein FN976_25715 [Caenimonas sedimenti]